MTCAKYTDREFFEGYFLEQVPEFREEYDAHVGGEGELLVHNLLGMTLVPFIEAQLRVGLTSNNQRRRLRHRRRGERSKDSDDEASIASQVVRRSMMCLEQALLHGDHDLREAILVSFIEDILKHQRRGSLSDHEVSALMRWLGPNLHSGFVAIQRFLDQPWHTDNSAPYEFIHWEPVAE